MYDSGDASSGLNPTAIQCSHQAEDSPHLKYMRGVGVTGITVRGTTIPGNIGLPDLNPKIMSR